jgi:hypothetical protein
MVAVNGWLDVNSIPGARFLVRHRRSIFWGAVCGGCVAAVTVRAKSMVAQLDNALLEAEDRAQRRRSRRDALLRIHTECGRATINFLPALHNRLLRSCDTSAIWKRIRDLRGGERKEPVCQQDELALWDELKRASITQALTGMYMFALLNLALRVQLHILGRAEHEMAIREKCMSRTFRHLLSPEIFRAMEREVGTVVARQFSDWSVQRTRCTEEELVEALRSVRVKLEAPNSAESPLVMMVVMAPDETGTTTVDHLLSETWDIVESPCFRFALEDALEFSFIQVIDRIHRHAFADDSPGGDGTPPPRRPLANVLPHLKRVNALWCAEPESVDTHAHIQGIAGIESVVALGISAFGDD